MVARAVSPTSAATSTMFAAATMRDPSAGPASSASNHSSAPAEPFARDTWNTRCDGAVADQQEVPMKRTPIRVEPFATYLERRRKGPTYPVVVAGDTVYVSGLPPFDPTTGDLEPMPFARQAEL